ncbi:MAG: hypothetical protein CAPSK01_001829 [Candidatus Accumulibacter vicinus]|uniref:Uncharacterized protein n=1 Tax=Candidatus Accumulibacter vicinus TaxID=2954382 RepID=A0A084Y140_9PROT|nr:MAG: hypothetical protein CAPSK01_001829 [Candidatus Accumulibacter vicinus]
MHWQTRSNTDRLGPLPGRNLLFVIVSSQCSRVLVIILRTGADSAPCLEAGDYPRQIPGLSEVWIKQIHGVEKFYICRIAGIMYPITN